jgi:hypothetical protein
MRSVEGERNFFRAKQGRGERSIAREIYAAKKRGAAA